ncbi:Major facilitator superfamily transporter [Pleurostoma richardsiae]|uniref:Major facilitator superfamily transporter n=1 Tax=Pleurostoma richardsiae TaxID=41990 RepID=A0AA38S1E6_9PEZI|nr:Major facilitator superfamily transporter [Pleurostoma richardsiae]
MALMRFLPFSASTTPLQAVTYLLGISLFSISFLVFLNSSISFVVTDLIGVKDGVGDIVGTLGFVDELVALVACPLWGLASDRLGVRNVAVLGYAIIGLGLFVFVQAANVYPQLLLARILFAIGATAAATMVTAILPSLTDDSRNLIADPEQSTLVGQNQRDSVALSVESELTITPERFLRITNGGVRKENVDGEAARRPSALAGYVGLFTGCGALVALALFLPLPARFNSIEGINLAQALVYSFYVVGTIAFLVALFVFIGLRDLKGEEGKGWRMLLGLKHASVQEGGEERGDARTRAAALPYWHLLKSSVKLGFTDSRIALGYLGGFVARASSVAIALFIPLFVNSFYLDRDVDGDVPPSRQAYILASILTGVSQLIALICAPLFGYVSSRSGRFNVPIVVATAFGIIGYAAFPNLSTPEYKDVKGRGGTPAVFLLVSLIGISQIGAIVCSLGSLGRGVIAADVPAPLDSESEGSRDQQWEETEALLGGGPVSVAPQSASRVQLKGTIAGVYSWCGGAAILLLTKLGGFLFDKWTRAAPFYLMAIFNGILLVASVGVDITHAARKSHRA